MTTIFIAIAWLIVASITLGLSLITILEMHDAPGIIEFIRAIFVGSLINAVLTVFIIGPALPELWLHPRTLNVTTVLLFSGFMSLEIPIIVFQLALLQKTEWFRRHILATIDNGGPEVPRVTSGGPVALRTGQHVIVPVKRLTSSKTFWIGVVTVVIAAMQLFGALPVLAPYRDEMLAIVGVLMVVLRVVTNQPVNLK